MKLSIGFIVLLLIFTSCSRRASDAQNFTLGQVQMKISRGMTQTEVAQALGAPNIITQDAEGLQAWVYDKMGSSVEYYNQGGGFWLVLVGREKNRGGATTTQKTLTVVIRFDRENKVSNVTYHSSQF